ncbi:hypothetical protein L1887_55957 [Cichorium endivia]|nr:hypothetical protein L1887_55957 [Cichorium endivia]
MKVGRDCRGGTRRRRNDSVGAGWGAVACEIAPMDSRPSGFAELPERSTPLRILYCFEPLPSRLPPCPPTSIKTHRSSCHPTESTPSCPSLGWRPRGAARRTTQMLAVDGNYAVAPSISLSTTFRSPHPSSAHAKQLEEAVRGEAEFDMQDPGFHHLLALLAVDQHPCRKGALADHEGARAHLQLRPLGSPCGRDALCSDGDRDQARIPRRARVDPALRARVATSRSSTSTDDYQAAMASSNISAEDGKDAAVQRGGLLVWVETPLNPTGEARDLAKYVTKARAVAGAHVVVDSTFAPPPLQDPFAQGVDMVMHSGTKYFWWSLGPALRVRAGGQG